LDQFIPLERRFVAHASAWVDSDRAFIAISDDNMADCGRSLFIQTDTLFVIEPNMMQRCATPTYANIDVPLAGVVLTDMNVGDRTTRWAQRGQFALQY